jgi:hypothetical protein
LSVLGSGSLKKEEQKNTTIYSKVQIRRKNNLQVMPCKLFLFWNIQSCNERKQSIDMMLEKCPTHLLQMPNAKFKMPNAFTPNAQRKS